MEVIELEVNDRVGLGSGNARRLRLEGQVPAVVYRKGADSKSIVLNGHDFEMSARGKPHSQLFRFKGTKEVNGYLGLVKAVEVDPIKGRLLHVEFLAVNEDQNITVSVPIVLTGVAECVRLGTATINQIIYELLVECKPSTIPTEFVIDITNLQAGASYHASDIKLPEGVKLKSVSGLTIVSAVVDRKSAAAADKTETEAATADTTAAKK